MVGSAREALVHVRDQFPAPFAQLAGELVFELDAQRPDHVRTFLLQIDLFEATVAFFSFLQLAELDARGLPIAAAEPAIAMLRDNPRITTGFWWGLLRETSRDLAAGDARASHPASRLVQQLLVDDSGQATPFARVLDSVPGIRNRIKGHAWTLPPDRYAAESERLLALTGKYLRSLESFAEISVVEVLGCTPAGDRFSCEVLVYVGDGRRPGRTVFTTDRPLEAGHVLAVLRRELAAGEVDRALDLAPFVQIRRDAGRDDIVLLQGIDAEASLLSIAPTRQIRCAASATAAITRLDRLLVRSRRARDAVARWMARARDVATHALAHASARASYAAATYLVRRRLVDHVDDMVAKGGTLLVVGPSGSGKTSFACSLVDHWRTSERGDRAVVLTFASEIALAGSIEQLWLRSFDESLDASVAVLLEHGTHVVVVVDGLDNVANPEYLARELARTSRRLAGGVTIVATGLEAIGPLAERAFSDEGAPLAVTALPALTSGEVRHLYALMRASTAQPELDISPDIFATPLLVRIAANGSHARQTAGAVLLELLERKVFHDPVKSHLVLKLADLLLEHRTKTVALDAMLAHAELRSTLLTVGAANPLRDLADDAILIVEHVTRPSLLPVPREARVGFAFDQLFEYVLFARAMQLVASPREVAARLGPAAVTWSPAVGAMRFWILETLAHEAGDVAERAVGELLGAVPAVAARRLLEDLLAIQRPHPRFVAALASGALDGETVRTAALAALARIERRGDAAHAIAVCEMASQVLGMPAAFAIEMARVQLEMLHVHAGTALARGERALASAREHQLGPASELIALDAIEQAARYAGARERRYSARGESRSIARDRELADPVSRVLGWLALAPDEDDPDVVDVPVELAAFAATLGHAGLLFRLRVREAFTRRRGQRQRTADRALIQDGLLEAARASGSLVNEARALRIIADFWHDDPDRELALIERGLAIAEESRDPCIHAELLYARARLRLKTGQFDDADADARAAETTFARLGHRSGRLRTLQHVRAICAWERGAAAELRATLEEAHREAHELANHGEAVLSSLLLSQVHVELGRLDAAQAQLDRAAELHAETGAGGRLCFALARGRVLALEGRRDEARAAFREARAFGDAERFSDFVFQPSLLLAWGDVLEDGASLEATRAALSELLGGAGVSSKHLDRYAGEIQALYALVHALLGGHEEAKVWSERAAEWLAAHPGQRSTAAIHAIEAVLSELEARRLGKGPRADGLRRRARQRAGEHVRDALAKMVESCEADEARGFLANHVATRLLARYGLSA